MKIAFDTNILLDAIANRQEHQAAQALILAVAQEKVGGVVAASSITDIYYIAKKYIGHSGARAAVENILTVFDIAGIDGEDCAMALETGMKDYEDAVLAVCAAREGCDYIVTRDEGFINEPNCPVPPAAPGDILKLID